MNRSAVFVVSLSLAFQAACGSSQQSSETPSKETLPLPPISRATPPPVLAKIAKAYMPDLRKCAHAVMKKDASAAGVYRVEFELHTTGKVTALDINGSSKELRGCMESHVNKWTFAPVRDENNKLVDRTLSVPMSFKPPANTVKADVEMIKVINARYMAGIHDCHKTALKTDPKAAGRVKLRYTVNVDGSITMATALGIPNAGLLSCIRRKMLTWRLPAPKGADGKPTTKTAGITVLLQTQKTPK